MNHDRQQKTDGHGVGSQFRCSACRRAAAFAVVRDVVHSRCDLKDRSVRTANVVEIDEQNSWRPMPEFYRRRLISSFKAQCSVGY